MQVLLRETGGNQSSAVDKLATESAALAKRGIAVPFVFADVKSFLPSWADLHGTGDDRLSDDEGEFNKGCKALADVLAANGDKQKGKRLDIMKWQAAFDKYMLAAAITEQLSLSAAMAHKDICVQVGMRAQFGAVTRRAALGVIYDEVARRSWAQRAAAGDFQSFHDISVAAIALDPVLLREAEAIYDAGAPAKANGKGWANQQAASGTGGFKSKGVFMLRQKWNRWVHLVFVIRKREANAVLQVW